MSLLPNDGNQQTTYVSSYKMETMSELYNIKLISDGTFLLPYKLTDCYQKHYPILMEKLYSTEYQTGSFWGGRNTIELVIHEDKILIPQQLQNTLLNSIKCISFILDYIKQRRWFANTCSGHSLDNFSRRKSHNVMYANVKNGQQNNTVRFRLGSRGNTVE